MITVERVRNGIPMHMFVEQIRKHMPQLRDPCIIFDIGSRDGDDAQYLKNHLGKNTIAYAFEAHPDEYKIHMKRHNGNLNWVNLAIYNYDGEVTFHPKAINSGIHSIRDRGKEFGTGEIVVPCKKISTFLRENNIECPSIVKVDVEGCSLEVLQGFEDYIHQVQCFHIESEEEKYFKDQYLQDEVFKLLEEKGFVMTMYSTTPGSNQHDSVWINSAFKGN